MTPNVEVSGFNARQISQTARRVAERIGVRNIDPIEFNEVVALSLGAVMSSDYDGEGATLYLDHQALAAQISARLLGDL